MAGGWCVWAGSTLDATKVQEAWLAALWELVLGCPCDTDLPMQGAQTPSTSEFSPEKWG